MRSRIHPILTFDALAALTVVLVASGCGRPESLPVRAERAVLERELGNLTEYRDHDFGRLLVEGDLLVVVREELVDALLEAALPVTGVLPGGYRVRLDGARVDLRTGLALVELEGRASLVEQPDTFADVTVHAALELVGLAGDPPVIRSRLEVLGLETREVGVTGISVPAARLVDEIARRRLGALGDLLGPLELPVSLQQAIELPAIEGEEVRIPSVSVATAARVDRVLVADDRLWVSIDLEIAPESAPLDEPGSGLDAGRGAGRQERP